MITGLTNDFVELTINSMKQFALFITTKQSACNFSAPQEGPEKIFSLASLANPPPIDIFVILTLGKSPSIPAGWQSTLVRPTAVLGNVHIHFGFPKHFFRISSSVDKNAAVINKMTKDRSVISTAAYNLRAYYVG